ncbi:MAG: MaoC family dehydratase N-terminal domain-containing protein [Dehalococcoidia bacterium]
MSGAEPAFEYDHDIIGVEFQVGQATITKEHIARYCAAVGETNPLYLDEAAAARGPYGTIVAPPSILSALLMEPRPDPDVRFGNTSYAAGTRFEYFEPVRAGDTIRVSALVKEVYAKTGRSGTMVFAVYQSRYRNQHDAEVAFEEFARVFRQA